MYQKVLLQQIKQQLPEGKSLNEEIAKVLEISYDASHRRASLKSKFSFEESVLLAKYFDISLDSLFGLTHKQFVSVERTRQITNEEELQSYFESTYLSLKDLLYRKDCEILYSAKDIPIFYTLKNNRLSHFKMYAWLKMLDKSFRAVTFDEYYPKLSTVQSAVKLGELYEGLQTSEIWDTTTINSTLKQIHFYYKSGNLSLKSAVELCVELTNLLKQISAKVIAKKDTYKLFYNELLLMDNNVLIQTSTKQSLFTPFSMLSYFYTSDKTTCAEAKVFFDKQLKSSKLLNTSGEKEQNKFYNKMMQKVNALQNLVKAEQILDFE